MQKVSSVQRIGSEWNLNIFHEDLNLCAWCLSIQIYLKGIAFSPKPVYYDATVSRFPNPPTKEQSTWKKLPDKQVLTGLGRD